MNALGVSVAAAVLLSACATTRPTIESSAPVPAARMLAYATPMPDSATMYVVRDAGFAGSLVNFDLLVDGKIAARIGSGEIAKLFISPGDRILEVRHPSERFGAAGDSETLQAASGSTYFFLVNSDLGSIQLSRTTETAMKVAR